MRKEERKRTRESRRERTSGREKGKQSRSEKREVKEWIKRREKISLKIKILKKRNRTPKNEKRPLETSGLFSLLIISALWTWLFGISALPRFRLLICESLTEDGTYRSQLLICKSLTEDGTYG
ncbi:unnamed protein product [Rhizophagus irregularis]|nr:unnamed protein product [Rhizophagus irregularis]